MQQYKSKVTYETIAGAAPCPTPQTISTWSGFYPICSIRPPRPPRTAFTRPIATATAYRDRYGMTRTQWRVLANLGKFGAMTARDICAISHIEKTKVSRAISALEGTGVLTRTTSDKDRRVEILSLTDKGKVVFTDLGQLANQYDSSLREQLGISQANNLEVLLQTLKLLAPGAANEE